MNKNIKELILYGLDTGILDKNDQEYAINKLLDLLELTNYIDHDIEYMVIDEPSSIVKPLLDYAVKMNIIKIDTVLNRDLFEAKIMDTLIQRPSTISNKFYALLSQDSKKATEYFYNLSKKSNYIKTSRTDKNIIWKSNTPYGLFDMTINLSKPEKDPKDIIASKNLKSTNYPKCLLCKEHVGFGGMPGRSSHRIIPLNLNEEKFYLQYSPYVYYNEHCIVLHENHTPMDVTKKTFERLFDFVDLFPHYFLGSNAGLPIVGGSILSHEHYQGGNHHFAIEDAEILKEYLVNDVKISKVKWPLSVIRLESNSREKIVDYAAKLFTYFEKYNNSKLDILSHTDAPHNAITPIARKNDSSYILDIALRNNRTTKEYPLGIFHPHKENHNIKKENIGLIEVMGLAVLPSRLVVELKEIKEALINEVSLPKESLHHEWLPELLEKYQGENIDTFIEKQVTLKFVKCLENAGIFKQDQLSQDAFDLFIEGYINVLTS